MTKSNDTASPDSAAIQASTPVTPLAPVVVPDDGLTFPGHSIFRAPPAKSTLLHHIRRAHSNERKRWRLLSCDNPCVMDAREYSWGLHRIFFRGVRFSKDNQHVLLHLSEELDNDDEELRAFTRVLTVQRYSGAISPSEDHESTESAAEAKPVTITAVWPRLPVRSDVMCEVEDAYTDLPASTDVWADRQCGVAIHTGTCSPGIPQMRGSITSPSSAQFSSEGQKRYRGVYDHDGFYILVHLPEASSIEATPGRAGIREQPALTIGLDVCSTTFGMLGRSRKLDNLATHVVTVGTFRSLDVLGILRELLERPDLIPLFDP